MQVYNNIIKDMTIIIDKFKLKDIDVSKRNSDYREWDNKNIFNRKYFIISKSDLYNMDEDNRNDLINYIKFGTKIQFINDLNYSQIKTIIHVDMEDDNLICYYK